MHKNKNFISIIILFLFVWQSLFAVDFSLPKDDKEETPLQQIYDGFNEEVPVYIMLKTQSTSVIADYELKTYDEVVKRVMVKTEKIKPVTMDKWLYDSFGQKKAKNSLEFISKLADERYPVPVVGVCQPYLFKISTGYVVQLSFYRFEDKGYPLTVLRNISSFEQLFDALEAMISEYSNIVENGFTKKNSKIKVLVKPFELDCRKYIGQSDGVFDYIIASFIEQDGVVIKPEDDMFSRLFSYLLHTTCMVQPLATIDLNQYVEKNYNSVSNVDFYIEGKIQLTDQINIFNINLFNAKSGKLIKNVKYFISDFSIDGTWTAYRNIITSLADDLFGVNNYGVVPDVNIPGQGLFLNNVFIGWNVLTKCVLPKGKHIIYTGSFFKPDVKVKVKNKNKATDINGDLYRSFFIYLDDRNWLFRGKDQGAQHERTVVRPSYSYFGDYIVNERAIHDIIHLVQRETPGIFKVVYISHIDSSPELYSLVIAVKLRKGYPVWDSAIAFQNKVQEMIEKMTAFNVVKVNVEIRGIN